jgi:PAS domain S-box-containing protein
MSLTDVLAAVVLARLVDLIGLRAVPVSLREATLLKPSARRIRSITQRRRLMRKHRQDNEVKCREFADSLPQTIVEMDGNGTLTFANRGALDIFGYTQEDYDKGLNALQMLIPEDRENAKETIQKSFRGETVGTIEYTALRKDGTTFPVIVHSIPVMLEKQIVGIRGILVDITEQKRLEDELKKHANHLEELVEERTGALREKLEEELNERNEEIKAVNASIIKRLTQKIDQIDDVAKTRERLRTTPDVSTGLNLVLDTALEGLGMDAGAIYTIDLKMNAARLRNFKSRIEGIRVDESFSLDAKFACMGAVKQNRAVSKVIGQQEQSILKTASIHCAPIHLGKELHGFLALGSKDAQVLDNSDLAILGLYADLASTIFETQSLTVTPVKEGENGTKRRFELEFGNAYLVKNNVEKAFEVFADNVLSGFEGLCITREFPPRVRKKYGLEKTPIIWLTEERTEGQMTVHTLQDLSIIIRNFLEKTRRGIVLLDGSEYLITNHGFESFIRFLQLNRSRIEYNDAILIAPLSEEALEPKQEKLIIREMSTFESKQDL